MKTHNRIAWATTLLLLALPVTVQAEDFIYAPFQGSYVITKYTGTVDRLDIPSTINGTNVTSIESYVCFSCTNLTHVTIGTNVTRIGYRAFSGCTGLTSLTIPSSVTSLEQLAFCDCSSLTGIYFKGNAPRVSSRVFDRCPATIYYLPGTTGWGKTFGNRPTAVWVR